eukprot:3369557-Amphidinium_carterae.2
MTQWETGPDAGPGQRRAKTATSVNIPSWKEVDAPSSTRGRLASHGRVNKRLAACNAMAFSSA